MTAYTTDTLENGIRVVHVPMRGNPAVTVMALVGVGSEYERENEAGISHFLEHMVFKGTNKRPKSMDLSRELDEIGAVYNAATSREYTAYYVKAARVHLDKVTGILADMTLDPILRDEDIEREKGVILEEINMYRDTPQERVAELFTNSLYGDQPAGRDIAGTKESVSALTQKNFISFRKRHYIAKNIVVVIAGGVSREKALKAAENYFASAREGELRSKRKVRSNKADDRVVLEHKKTDQTHVILGGRACHRFHKDRWTLYVLQSILDGGMSSRIFQRVREEMGAAYYAGFDISTHTDYGTWGFSAGVTTSRAEEVIRVALEEFKDLRDGTVDPKELRKAKDHLVGSLLLSLETSSALARFYGFQELFKEEPIRTPREIREHIQQVAPEDVMRVAQTYLKPENMLLAIVGPHKKREPFGRVLKEAVIL